jgi:hypothetical protein
MSNARAVRNVLPTPWRAPARVELVGDSLRWGSATREVSVAEYGAELAKLLDSFVLLGRPDGRRGGEARSFAKASAFSKQWGPWPACGPAWHHVAFSPSMRPPLDLPKGPGYVEGRAEPIRSVIDSARAVNALRTIVGRARAGAIAAEPVWTALYAQDRLATGVRRRQAIRDHARGPVHDVIEFADDLIARWWRATHVVPAVGMTSDPTEPLRFAVGGVAGALAVAMYAERESRQRTATCNACGTTWCVWKDWDQEMALGSDRCQTCKAADNADRRRKEGLA